jgi:hypothetical protein
MYFFNNGFGYVSDSVQAVFDLTINSYLDSYGLIPQEFKEYPKAYLQVLSNDFTSR